MFGFFLLDGLVYLLLGVVAAYAAVTLAKSRGVTQRGKTLAGAMAFFVVFLFPFWDWLPTVLYHQHLCNTQAGVKINRSVEGVEGFLGIGIGELTVAEEWGYKYVYRPDYVGGYIRIRKNSNPPPDQPWKTEIREPATEPIYGYQYEITRGLPWHAVKNTYTTYVIATGEVLGTFIDFGYTAADPNASMSEWRKPWLNSYSCEGGAQRARLETEVVLKTLKPVQAKN